MFPLWMSYIKMLKRKKPSPIPNINRKYICLARGYASFHHIKGIPQLGRRKVSASMTVEAAVIIPLFLFFFVNLMSGIEMMRLHGNLQMTLWKQGRLIAIAGHLAHGSGVQEDDMDTRNSLLLRLGGAALLDYGVEKLVVQDLGREYLEHSPLTYGAFGLQIWESSYDNDCVDIKVTYQVSPIFQIPGFRTFRMANRYYAKAWTGYQIADEDITDHMVYVTAYGKVYHESADCAHLKRTIQKIRGYEIASLRSYEGEHYVSCGFCMEDKDNISPAQWLYVTLEGERYHVTIQCPALKRIVRSIQRYEAVKDYRPCSDCNDG